MTQKTNKQKPLIMQISLIVISLALIVIGIAFEKSTPLGWTNGLWTFALIVPTTAFLVSVINWSFIQFYKSRKMFSNFSSLITLVFTFCSYIVVAFHYGGHKHDTIMILQYLFMILQLYFWIIAIVIAVCVLSKILSNAYAKMVGKE